MMILSIFVSLLFFLLGSDAAPALADDQTLSSHPLQKRAGYSCYAPYGKNIVESDCQEAWKKIWQEFQEPQTGLLFPSVSNDDFIRRLEKRRAVRSCAIIVDLKDLATTPTTTAAWQTVADSGQELVGQCVGKHGMGGEITTLGVKTIVHKNSVDVSMYIAQQRQTVPIVVARALEHISDPPGLG